MIDSGKTKQAIFETAATLFAQEGYSKVSMKHIAQAVGITPPSIYNHYSSKDAILMSMYKYLDETCKSLRPDLEELMKLCETAHPHEVMRGTICTFPEEITHLMYCVLVVTISMMRTDARADDVLNRSIIKPAFEYDIPLLNKLQALGRIEPIEAEHFALIHSCYYFSAAVRFCTPHTIQQKEWLEGADLLFQLVRPTV